MSEKIGRLTIRRKIGETIVIDDNIRITVSSIEGRIVALVINAPESIHIDKARSTEKEISGIIKADLAAKQMFYPKTKKECPKVPEAMGRYSCHPITLTPSYFLKFLLDLKNIDQSLKQNIYHTLETRKGQSERNKESELQRLASNNKDKEADCI